MSILKKVLSLVLVAVITAGVAISGTVAYLTSDDSDVNVMTLGNVKIAQHEYERVVNEDGTLPTETIDGKTSYLLQDFTQGKALLPATDPTNHGAGNFDDITVRMSQVNSYGGAQVFVNPNAQDKFVTVENTGKTDAYVRTLVAIECGDGDANLIGILARATKTPETSVAPWVSNNIGEITVAENTYYLLEYVYRGANDVDIHKDGVLPAGETTYPNLCQVYLKSAATNEDCEKLDGNDNGTLDILVVSQAVQAQGFENAQTALDAAFGDITTTNHPWVDGVVIPTVVDTFDELKEAINEGGYIALAADIEVAEMVEIPANGSASIDGGGYTLTRADSYTGTILSLGEYAELELSNITLDGENVESTGNLIYIDSFGKLTLNDGAVLENHVGGTTYENDPYRGPENSVIHCDGATTIVMNEGSVIQNNIGKGNFATVIASMYDLTCELNGGKIINNISEKNNYTVNFGNYANITVSDGFEAYGNTDGGLLRVNQQSTFTMNGGKLDGNGKTAIHTHVAKYVTLNDGEIIGNVSLNYSPATVGGTDVEGYISKDNEVTKWALNLTPDFGTVRYKIAGNITQLNIVPAEGYTYAEGDEAKLICENTGYETYWDAESGCFKVKASE
ncbi:MAG: hypothetical protein IJ306_04070 [Oscillospiraceae bacterium]|nr:hypothetical protein [Oscillospiraceae bacterium]